MAQLLKEGGEMLLDRYSLIRIGFGWELFPRQYAAGLLGSLLGGGRPEAADCDGSALLFGRDGRPVGGQLQSCCIYYGNTNLYDFALVHNGDNLTGIGSGDDESIFIDLGRLPEEVERVALTFDFFKSRKKLSFGRLQEVAVRVVDDPTGEEVCRFEPESAGSGGKALLAAQLYRTGGGWVFRAEGKELPEARRKEDLMAIRFEKK
ncbi:MAG: TerD family protein [Firmicutes bacterium]|jgi:stress response protein SCP2|nr:TerD family protein [Bacillota bacterium]